MQHRQGTQQLPYVMQVSDRCLLAGRCLRCKTYDCTTFSCKTMILQQVYAVRSPILAKPDSIQHIPQEGSQADRHYQPTSAANSSVPHIYDFASE